MIGIADEHALEEHPFASLFPHPGKTNYARNQSVHRNVPENYCRGFPNTRIRDLNLSRILNRRQPSVNTVRTSLQ
jgi:hypothetical protein